MSHVRELLLDIARELNRPPSSMEKFIGLLESNWFDSYESMRNLDLETLDSLGFPKMLSNVILERLSNIPLSSKPKTGMIEETKTPSPPALEGHEVILRRLIHEIGNKENLHSCLDIMFKLLNNILQEPRNMKFRSFKVSNPRIQQFVTKYKAAMQVFEYLNFRLVGETMELPENSYEESKMRITVRAIDSHIKDLSPHVEPVSPEKFNPFQESVISQVGPSIKDLAQKSGPMVSDYMKMLDDLKAKRLSLIRPISNREIKFVKISHSSSGTSHMHQEPSVLEEEQLIKEQILKVMSSMKQSQNFSSLRRKEFEALAKKPLFVKTLIRFRFPNDRVLQAVFSPLEKMESLYAVVQQVVAPGINFYLYQSPPLQKLAKNAMESLDELSLVPQANVFVGIEGFKAGQELFKNEKSIPVEEYQA